MLTLVMTTSKRLDYFKQTLDSLRKNFKDRYLFSQKLIVDDSSSMQDRFEMMALCEGWEFVLHNRLSHPQSIILMQAAIRNNYYFLLEDDWLFTEKREYGKMCMNKMRECPDVGLVSLMQSGPVDGRNVLIPPTDKGWPGWNLLPGMHDRTKEKPYQDIFNHECENAKLFEGRVGYLGNTYVEHIGKVTAYSLNGSSR
jgi:hypothetical protein